MNDWEILQSQNRMHTGFYIMRYPPCAASVAKPWGNHYDASTFFSFVTILYQYREVKGTQDVIGCGILWDWFLIYCTVLYISFWQFHEIVWQCIYKFTSGPRRIAAIFQATFSNAFSLMKMYEFRLKFQLRLLLRVQLTIFQHWIR